MKLSRLLPVFGILIFSYIIWTSQPLKIAQSFLNLNPNYLALALAMTLAVLFLKGLKWKTVIKLHGLDYPLKDSCKVWSIGLFAGIVTPGRIGDLVRSLYLNKRYKAFGRCLSAVIVDRIIDLLVVFIFAVFGILLFIQRFGPSLYMTASFSFLALFLVLLYLATKKKFAEGILRPIFNFLAPEKYREKLRASFHDFYKSIDELKKKKRGVFSVFILTVLIWFFSIFQAQVIALTVNVDIDYVYLLAVMSLVVIIELVPISVSGIGTREAFLIFALGLIGIGKESAIAFSILYLLAYWFIGVIGFFFWVKNPVKLRISEKP